MWAAVVSLSALGFKFWGPLICPSALGCPCRAGGRAVVGGAPFVALRHNTAEGTHSRLSSQADHVLPPPQTAASLETAGLPRTSSHIRGASQGISRTTLHTC
ncbi:hypothetical protein B0T26DRAFT_714585 [Lasiosphaeria miniovina]|uniref:Secreted protein n=1 Tax=Lasiosphaeria miniovina TaxID=1954250 RepID=A0AA40AAZ5_9PEZI|nr:uncharacterized protein B0T26DRAFT_714585 [Lasiosphaeria miniovina]KAK0712546.1 hypothetical protein B0T26DRAFT_714585 [Lasiosphaeria miniovina]